MHIGIWKAAQGYFCYPEDKKAVIMGAEGRKEEGGSV